MSKDVKFAWSGSDNLMTFNLVVQQPKNPMFESTSQTSGKAISLDAGGSYIYVLHVTGPMGATYQMTISGATTAYTPIKGKIETPPDASSKVPYDFYTDTLVA